MKSTTSRLVKMAPRWSALKLAKCLAGSGGLMDGEALLTLRRLLFNGNPLSPNHSTLAATQQLVLRHGGSLRERYARDLTTIRVTDQF